MLESEVRENVINLQYIRNRRKAFKINQAEMAVILGLGSAANYGTYELGKAEFKADHLPLLCGALDCNIEDLYNDGVLPNDKSIDDLLEAIRKRWRS